MTTVDPRLAQEINKMEDSIQNQMSQLRQFEAKLNQKEMSVRQNLLKGSSPDVIEANLKSSLPGFLVPGNVGDINRVIWPFFFSNDLQEVAPNETVVTNFSVTQEASFVMMQYSRVVYLRTEGPDNLVYIQPSDNNYDEYGLKFTVTDPQSGRSFFNIPLSIRQVGDPRFPTAFPSPELVLPNATVQVTFTNEHPTNVYVPILSFFGYRVRIDSSTGLLSTIYG